MDFDRRDAWEAAEAKPGREQDALRDNRRVRSGKWRATTRADDDPMRSPRAMHGRAPAVFRPGAWMPMREYAEGEEVEFAIVGTGVGGGTLACKLAEADLSVVAFDAGPHWCPPDDFASDEEDQSKLYWRDRRIVDGDNPLQLGSNNSGKSVGGSTVHFATVSLRLRPDEPDDEERRFISPRRMSRRDAGRTSDRCTCRIARRRATPRFPHRATTDPRPPHAGRPSTNERALCRSA